MQAERIRYVLIQCSDSTQGASALPVDVGYLPMYSDLGLHQHIIDGGLKFDRV